MYDKARIEQRLRDLLSHGERWGIRGTKAVARIERGLGLGLQGQLRLFIEQIGNVRVDPFEIIAGGDDDGRISAVTTTQSLWSLYPSLRSAKAIKLMEHAGEVYLYFPDDEGIRASDALRPVAGEETLSWSSLEPIPKLAFCIAMMYTTQHVKAHG